MTARNKFKVQQLLVDRLNLNYINIERVHRVKGVKGTNNYDSKKARTTYANFWDTNIIKYLKMQINWNEALSISIMTLVKLDYIGKKKWNVGRGKTFTGGESHSSSKLHNYCAQEKAKDV